MNYSFNQNADLSDSVRIGKVITHCPSCGQIVSNLSYSSFGSETWPDHSDAGLQHCYCPTCHLVLEGWFRMKLNQPPELSAIRWEHSQVSGPWETTDRLFGEPMDPSRGQLVANWRSFKHFCVMRSDEKRAKESEWTQKHGKSCWV